MTDMHEGATPKRPKLHPIRMQKTPAHLNGAAELEKLCFSSPWSASSLELLTNDGIGVGYLLTVPAAPGSEPSVAAYGGMLITVDEGQITNIAVHPSKRGLGYGKRIVKDLILKDRHGLLVNTSIVDCDFYRFLEGDIRTINSFTGQYMSAYSWAEFTVGYLENQVKK